MKRLTSLFLVLLLLSSLFSTAYAADTTTASTAESDCVETSSDTRTEPEEPAVPADPADPGEPSDPDDPDDPAEPDDPNEPDDPDDPDDPEPRPDEEHKPFISGMPDGSFSPNATVTRAELAVMLYALGDYAPGPKRFSDVRSNAWYAEAVNALAAAGVVAGFTDGTFRPKATASRAELVTILAAISGEEPSGLSTFPDVSSRYWAARPIALAQEKGWVSGFPDGSFRPANPVSRAETVVILMKFLERSPDHEAIAAGENLRFFPDVRKSRWYYEAVMEASTYHCASFDENGNEHWYNMEAGDLTTIPDGFYCFDNRIFAVENGSYVRSAETRTLNGIRYHCAGKSGACTVEAEVLTLANGNLILLKDGKLMAAPGNYEDGFYLKAGHLFVVKDGYVLNKQSSGSYNGVAYRCAGSNGHCTVDDWTRLSLSGIDLSVFSNALTPDATASGSSKVTVGEALRAAVRVYEAYFRVAYPVRSDEMQDYIDKALEYGILDAALSSYNQPLKCGELAIYLCRALHGRELDAINVIPALPDVDKSESCYDDVLALYRAGVMTSTEAEHNACISAHVTVSELAAMLTRLEQADKRVYFSIKVLKTIQYGTSGSGSYPLTAYQLGDGKNVMVLSFALHGWEDNWDRDGKALVYIADQLNSYLDENYDLIRDGDWTVYILRCLNPDGLYLGTTCNGPGRCTTTYYNSNGQLQSDRGIDMNRCFPYNFQSFTGNRNYNGSAPLACAEAKAVADFVTAVKGSGYNILIDTHGWFSQIITSSGKGTIYDAFLKQFPGNSYASLYGGSGYFSSWAAYVQGYDSCLLELPDGLYSYNAFLSSNYPSKFNAAIQDLLQHYNGPSSTKRMEAQQGSTDEASFELDGN